MATEQVVLCLEDVVFEIIAQLADDKPSLQSCSLVSTSWMRPSRRYLFTEVSVDLGEDGSKLAEFLSILRAQPAISRAIQCLHMTGIPFRSRISPSSVRSIIKGLPNIKAVSVADLRIVDADPEVEQHANINGGHCQSHAPLVHRRLQRVSMSKILCPLSTLTHFLHFIPCEELQLGEIQVAESPSTRSEIIQAGYTPRSLIFGTLLHHSMIHRLILPIIPLNHLHTLEAEVWTVEELEALGCLIHRHATSLYTVHVKLSAFISVTDVYWRVLNLSSCASLTTLGLTIHLGCSSRTRFSTLCDTLAACGQSAALKRVIYTVHAGLPNGADEKKAWVAKHVCADECARLDTTVSKNAPYLDDLEFVFKARKSSDTDSFHLIQTAIEIGRFDFESPLRYGFPYPPSSSLGYHQNIKWVVFAAQEYITHNETFTVQLGPDKILQARTRDIDQIQLIDLDPKNRAALEAQPLDYEKPGLGQHYCVECAKYCETDAALRSHWRSKVHKRRCKQLKEPAYTIEEAERAAGLGREERRTEAAPRPESERDMIV
ncbi:Bud site selection protein 20 [Steccherinum ochraceum]|uniref:Bud site selection protein 20 n=1 Tax=Steccherinum ochraceum TaxID=92696 RepID=A0A4R0RTV4_9APHY|nr:Bud site selection protein 20 [Steccherinum ochraceum]